MKKKNKIIILITLIVIVLICTYDRQYQIENEFESMFSQTQEELDEQYGQGVERIFNLYRNEGYDKPFISMMPSKYSYRIVKTTENLVYLSTNKYDKNYGSYGNELGFDSTQLVFKFKKIPVLNLDILEEVVDEDIYHGIVELNN